MTFNFRHSDPANRLQPMNARLSIMHSFQFAFHDEAEKKQMFDFLNAQADIWLDQGLGLNADGSIGTTPTPVGRLPLFQVETPRNDLAMLFKLTFGGAA